MNDKEGFSVDELRKYHETQGDEERLVCPNCLFAYQGKEITDEYDLNLRGFSKEILSEDDGGLILARFGVCPCVPKDIEDGSFNIYGTPLILESEYEYELEFDESNNENNEIQLPSPELKFAFKSKMTNAIGDHLISQLEPPYKVAKYMSSLVKDTGGDEVKFEKVDEINTKNEWFNLLYPYLWDMRNLQSGTQTKLHILPTIYLHKTVQMNHIEPFWIFMRRFGMNLRAVKLSVSNYPSELPQSVQELVRKLQFYEVSRSSIDSFAFMSREYSLLGNLDNKQLNEIVDDASKILAGMKVSEYSDEKTIYQYISDQPLVSDNLKLGGNILPPVGIIEGFCLFAALSKNNPKIAEDFLQQMYPKEQSSIWQWSMTDLGQAFGRIDVLNGLIKMIKL